MTFNFEILDIISKSENPIDEILISNTAKYGKTSIISQIMVTTTPHEVDSGASGVQIRDRIYNWLDILSRNGFTKNNRYIAYNNVRYLASLVSGSVNPVKLNKYTFKSDVCMPTVAAILHTKEPEPTIEIIKSILTKLSEYNIGVRADSLSYLFENEANYEYIVATTKHCNLSERNVKIYTSIIAQNETWKLANINFNIPLGQSNWDNVLLEMIMHNPNTWEQHLATLASRIPIEKFLTIGLAHIAYSKNLYRAFTLVYNYIVTKPTSCTRFFVCIEHKILMSRKYKFIEGMIPGHRTGPFLDTMIVNKQWTAAKIFIVQTAVKAADVYQYASLWPAETINTPIKSYIDAIFANTISQTGDLMAPTRARRYHIVEF
jgi:hypothetical protein